MPIIAVSSRKGGIGKSSLAWSLAGAFAKRGSVVCCDCDDQRSLLKGVRFRDEPMPFELVAIDSTRGEAIMRRQLEAVVGDFDHAVLDLPPETRAAARTAARLADVVVLPVRPSTFDLDGAEDALEVYRAVRAERGGHLPRVVIVPNQLGVGWRLERDLLAALADLGETVTPPIHLRVAWSEATLRGRTIEEHEPLGAAAAEFREVVKWIRREVRK